MFQHERSTSSVNIIFCFQCFRLGITAGKPEAQKNLNKGNILKDWGPDAGHDRFDQIEVLGCSFIVIHAMTVTAANKIYSTIRGYFLTLLLKGITGTLRDSISIKLNRSLTKAYMTFFSNSGV